MDISVSMWSFDRAIQSERLRQVDFLNWVREKKIRYVELLSYYMEKEQNLEEIISYLKKTELSVSCYTILTDFTRESDDTFNELIHDIDVASKLDSPFVRVLAGESNPDEANAFPNIIKGLKKAVRIAERKNIILLIENIGRYSCHSSKVIRICEEVNSPFLEINFDTANPLLAREDVQTALKNCLPHLAFVHFKDFISQHENNFQHLADRDESRIQTAGDGTRFIGISAGEGIVPLKSVMNILAAHNYQGFVSIEYEGTGDSQADTEKSLEYLRTCL